MLQNPNTTSSTSASGHQQHHQQQQSHSQQQQQMPQPKLVVIRRRPNQGFGFTLRHFIAYPPEDDPSWPQEASEPYQVKAMETIFIKEVHPNGPAYYANLQTGDRVLMVNNTPIAGIAYSTIVSMIKQTPSELKLLVVPKECDVLQMHYTSIAHTPQSNVTGSCGPAKPASLVTGNGNTMTATASSSSTNSSSSTGAGIVGGGALLPMSVAMAGRPFPLHQQHQLISFPASQQQASSRSGSISSNNSLRPLTSSDYMELSASQTMSSTSSTSYHHNQHQHQYQHHTGNILHHSDSGSYLRSPPANLTVLTRQQQLQQQQNAAALYAFNNAVDTSDLMVRLRESIKQKEEFLKSPLPNVHQQSHHQQQQQQQPQQHFFPHTPPSGSPQLSMVSTSSTSVGAGSSSACVVGSLSFVNTNNATTGAAASVARGQVRTLVKQPLSATSSASSTRELLTANCDMHYAPNLGSSTTGGGGGGGGSSYGQQQQQQHHHHQQQQQQRLSTSGGSSNNSTNGSSSILRDKYHKDYEFMETLQETGVTNKVFESKLVSHLARGFDPFKPLSINTNAIETQTATTAAAAAAAASAAGNAIMKKPSVLYDSLHHHPLHQMQVQQQQHQQHPHLTYPLHHQQQQHHQQTATTAPKMTVSTATTPSSANLSSIVNPAAATSTSVVDGQRFSRMEIYKASLANSTIDHQKYASKLTDANELRPILTDIAEGDGNGIATTKSSPSSIANIASVYTRSAAATNTNVVRRFRPISSFDDSKPMRRISYLRATNDDYHLDTSATSLANSSTSSIAESLSTKSTKSIQQQIEEHPDPIYDVVGGADSTSDSLDALEDLKLDASCSSRRTSINSDLRHSVHIDSISGLDANGKFETKDVATDMEIFETEMEIKSSSIHGKRQSEYRSWRQVKIEIKGDILRIYPSRNTKSDSNVLELDIRNFEIFDESDKKKYVFRMQSKPSPLANLGNELNIDDVGDKLTSSTGSSSSTQQSSETTQQYHHHQQNHPHTDILFKTKSGTEMKRIYGLLQWKNSLIYNDNDLQGKQMAEPQKTAATASMSTTNSNYCDDNVQSTLQQQQQQHLQAEHSPISSTSRSELEAPDSISPVMKTRKSSSHKNIPDKDLGSPKAKNWKDLLFRRGGGSSSSGHSADLSPSNLSSSSKTIGSIGVPLKTCPMSKTNEYVPTLVEVCTNIVETKGLGVVGIYRIPGNKAAISELSDQVNKTDFSWDRCNSDVRWEDVNVVSSLLKLFIRSLPDALLPSSFYNHFIEADKKVGMERLTELKGLLEALPRYSHETMKHLFRHLNRVSKNCDVNLMEPKNLAIIFGPSIIRTPNDALDVAVKDMKHQCRIVELLLTHYDYFFENGETPDLDDVCGNNVAASSSSSTTGVTTIQQQQQENQTNMLLHNISKIERLTERESSSSSTTTTTRTSRFIPQLRKHKSSKRANDPSSYEIGLVSKSSSSSSSKSKSFTTNTSTTNTTSNNTKNTNIKHSLITTPLPPITTITKNTLKTICKSTPNISTLTTRTLSTTNAHNNHPSKSSSSRDSTCSAADAAEYRQRRRAVPTIYDFGVTLRLHFQSSDYTKSASGTTASSSSSSSTTTSSTKTSKKKEGFLSSRARSHARKSSLDEKDSGSVSGSSIIKETQRNSVDISINLTDDESSNSRLSEPGSMSLGIITDTLESKLSKLRSGSESNDENGSPDFPIQRRYTLGEPLHILHTENIPYADESPERHFHNFSPLDNIMGANNLMLSRSCTSTNTLMGAKSTNSEKEKSSSLTGTYKTTSAAAIQPHKLQHSATAPINSSIGSLVVSGIGLTSPPLTGSTPNTIGALKGSSMVSAATARNAYATSKNLRFSTSVHEQRCSEDDSEGSTTSDPKEALVMASPSFLLDKYNKKRRDHRLFRSASFNCRNYSSRYGGSMSGGGGGAGSMSNNMPCTGLTKDEKTDMNLTKKRQIQNKQNRSIKRRHTVGGPHDYSGGGGGGGGAGNPAASNNCKNKNNLANSASGSNASIIRRTPLSSANGNIANNNMQQHVEEGSTTSSNGNSSNISSSNTQTTNNVGGGGGGGSATTVNVANSSGEHVLEVGIRIKNINRARF
ncbi:rho GTPase activating protein at 19D isoform X2 [Haematobia irritans]|uniref:rho GTPase activating protein at 19D isoform X2 n=1 Tax=Haematobia irritans TaxID=7368 RepID=UPI003F501F64